MSTDHLALYALAAAMIPAAGLVAWYAGTRLGLWLLGRRRASHGEARR